MTKQTDFEDHYSEDSSAVAPQRPQLARAGLPGTTAAIKNRLRRLGVDPDRLSIFYLGIPQRTLIRGFLGLAIFIALKFAPQLGFTIPESVAPWLYLLAGLIIMQAACVVLVDSTERFAARKSWDHYIAGTVAEILSTIPELAVIAFLIPVSPQTAFIVTLITIYNNALIFSLYSYFLPKDQMGRFLMPEPITKAGTQILIGGAGVSLILGLVLLTFKSTSHNKAHFEPHDFSILALLLLTMFGVYLYKLVRNYAMEEKNVRESLELNDDEVAHRKAAVYENVKTSSLPQIGMLFLLGVAGAFIGGESVSMFAESAIHNLGLNAMMTALILAVFAGMSEYVILYTTHRKREYGIALANAFGGITQVMFLVLPFTLISIAAYQVFFNTGHPELPLDFNISHILLLLFLFPTFFVLFELIEEDHTLGILDTTIMTGIFVLLLLILVTYGSNDM